MKLPSSFDTSINQLLMLQNDNTHFLSTWNKGADHLEFSDEIICSAAKQYPKLKNEYFFSDDFLARQKILCKRRQAVVKETGANQRISQAGHNPA